MKLKTIFELSILEVKMSVGFNSPPYITAAEQCPQSDNDTTVSRAELNFDHYDVSRLSDAELAYETMREHVANHSECWNTADNRIIMSNKIADRMDFSPNTFGMVSVRMEGVSSKVVLAFKEKLINEFSFLELFCVYNTTSFDEQGIIIVNEIEGKIKVKIADAESQEGGLIQRVVSPTNPLSLDKIFPKESGVLDSQQMRIDRITRKICLSFRSCFILFLSRFFEFQLRHGYAHTTPESCLFFNAYKNNKDGILENYFLNIINFAKSVFVEALNSLSNDKLMGIDAVISMMPEDTYDRYFFVVFDNFYDANVDS